LVGELERARTALAGKPQEPYYIALAVTDRQTWSLAARDGTLQMLDTDRARALDVDVRVGSPALDSSRPLRGFSSFEGSSRQATALPWTDAPGTEAVVRHAVWRELDRQARGAAERFVMVKAERNVKVEEEVQAPDFEPRTGVQERSPPQELTVDLARWEPILVELSAQLDREEFVHTNGVDLRVERRTTTFVDTEGARLVHGITLARLSLAVSTTAPDGDEISVYRAFDVHDPQRFPQPEALQAWARDATAHLRALRDAPRATPFEGPVLLEGRATAVFFHEVFGHRVEGHRQKREAEGRTFAAKVGEPILPPFLDVVDDPTIASWKGTDLNGHYRYDDEGVRAQRAVLVEDGLFRGFLMSRSPLPDVPSSNGHGRRMPGNAPVARMGNTIIEASQTVAPARLRAMLLEEVKKQGLPYGYIVKDIDGGFTLTGRVMPNAFNVRANTVVRVWADGRPDELVRGLDLVGTPLVAFRNIVAASDRTDVFNGSCGAESGWVPVSAVAPDILVRRLEFQLKEKGQERPPLLEKPDKPDGSADAGGGR
jgi:predicted Zn-dependent protease